jgi:DNA repair protein RecO (recombination protein O)
VNWRDEGILIAARRHGESGAIVQVLTRDHGRHAGVVRGGGSRRMAPLLQPGAIVAVEWTARLEEHLGHFRIDPAGPGLARILADRAALAALGAIAALLSASLPEREAHPALYARTLDVVSSLGAAPDWPARYVVWELALLADLGFGLDLARCAVAGGDAELAFVSPRTGRAVSRAGAVGWEKRLLPLPAFLRDGWPEGEPPAATDLAAALRLSGHFLNARLAPTLPRGAVPGARSRAVEAMLRRAQAIGISG